jgi:HK97 family phage major capsid protein
MLSNEASLALELDNLHTEARRLAQVGTPATIAEASILKKRIETLERRGFSSDTGRKHYTEGLNASLAPVTASDTRYLSSFSKYIFRGENHLTPEQRSDLLAGTQSISYTQPQSGYLIPLLYETKLFTAMAQTDELLSSDICNFTVAPTAALQPKTLSGYDLSQVEAVQVGETVNQASGTFANVLGATLRSNITYRLSFAGSMEFEDDVPAFMNKIAIAMGIGFARRLGADAVNGNGNSQPAGILKGLTSVYSTGSGKITNTDIQNIYFSLNRIYRRSNQCAWCVSDSVHERLRLAVDNSGRPLLNVENDTETLMGKRIITLPSLGPVGGSLALNSTLLFGDLSHFSIRCSKATLQRTINQAVHGADVGEALYVGRMRMDSSLFSPSLSNGVDPAPPVVTASIVA